MILLSDHLFLFITTGQLSSATGLVWAPLHVCNWLQVSWWALFPGKVNYWLECLGLPPCVLSSSTNLAQASSHSSCWGPRGTAEDCKA